MGRACSWILVAALGLGVAFSAPVSAGRTDPFPHVGQRPEGERIGGESGDFSASSGSRYIIRATDPPALDRVVALLVELGITPLDQWRDNLAGLVARLDPSTVAELRSNPDVASIERDRPMEATSEQGSPPWGLDRIDQRSGTLDSVYAYSDTGAGVTAYVIDSGLWFTHTEFTGRVPTSAYWDFGDGWEDWDCFGHGTHVAGTVGGTTYGVAKQVTIIPVKVLDCNGNGTEAAVLSGINWVIDHHVAGIPAVANISVGGNPSAVVDSAVASLIADGVTVVVAAGNDNLPTCNYSPARVGAAITVAASETGDHRAAYSNYGSCNDIFAPGTDVLSAVGGSDTANFVASGTSMASPHVAGAVALLLEDSPGLTPAQVWSTISAEATTGVISPCCGDPDKLLYMGSDSGGFTGVGSGFVGLAPARLLESRSDGWTADGLSNGVGLRGAGSVTEVVVAGRGGVAVDAGAVSLNVTVVGALGSGYATVYPCGGVVPGASNLNFVAGQTVPNAVISKVGVGGKVCVYTSGATHLIVDVNGSFS